MVGKFKSSKENTTKNSKIIAINEECFHHIVTSLLIFRANQINNEKIIFCSVAIDL